MNFGSDIIEQLAKAPIWFKLGIGLTLFGLYWKKSQWPNHYLKFINLILPAIVYPILAFKYGDDPNALYWQPILTTACYGVMIGIACEFMHEGIVAKLKVMCPFINFPEDPPKEPQPTDPMKNIKLSLILIPILSLSLFNTGCMHLASTTNPSTGVVTPGASVPNVPLMCSTAKSAAYLGTLIYLNGLPPNLKGHPQDRAAFVTARNSLAALIAAGTFSSADLVTALQGLPVQELKGDGGTLIVGEAVILWDQYGQQLASLDKAQVFTTYILPVAKAIRDGLDMALGTTPTSWIVPPWAEQPDA